MWNLNKGIREKCSQARFWNKNRFSPILITRAIQEKENTDQAGSNSFADFFYLIACASSFIASYIISWNMEIGAVVHRRISQIEAS
jgi:hypothetical protein